MVCSAVSNEVDDYQPCNSIDAGHTAPPLVTPLDQTKEDCLENTLDKVFDPGTAHMNVKQNIRVCTPDTSSSIQALRTQESSHAFVSSLERPNGLPSVSDGLRSITAIVESQLIMYGVFSLSVRDIRAFRAWSGGKAERHLGSAYSRRGTAALRL